MRKSAIHEKMPGRLKGTVPSCLFFFGLHSLQRFTMFRFFFFFVDSGFSESHRILKNRLCSSKCFRMNKNITVQNKRPGVALLLFPAL